MCDGKLDIFSMCEVGGHRQGLKDAGINALESMQELKAKGIVCSNMQNYLSCWNFSTDAYQLGVRQLCQPAVCLYTQDPLYKLCFLVEAEDLHL